MSIAKYFIFVTYLLKNRDVIGKNISNTRKHFQEGRKPPSINIRDKIILKPN